MFWRESLALFSSDFRAWFGLAWHSFANSGATGMFPVRCFRSFLAIWQNQCQPAFSENLNVLLNNYKLIVQHSSAESFLIWCNFCRSVVVAAFLMWNFSSIICCLCVVDLIRPEKAMGRSTRFWWTLEQSLPLAELVPGSLADPLTALVVSNLSDFCLCTKDLEFSAVHDRSS